MVGLSSVRLGQFGCRSGLCFGLGLEFGLRLCLVGLIWFRFRFRSCQVRSGLVRSCQVMLGYGRLGSVRLGYVGRVSLLGIQFQHV